MTPEQDSNTELTRLASLAPAACYASGEEPQRGDLVEYAERLHQPILSFRERDELWIVTAICGDMIRCKCDGAETWRQAHYAARMRLIRRKRHNDKLTDSRAENQQP